MTPRRAAQPRRRRGRGSARVESARREGAVWGGRDRETAPRDAGWAAVSDSESSDEGERVVRSAKDRAWDGMRGVAGKLANARKINDWSGIQTEFEAFNKMVDKAKMHIQKEGLPRFYIKALADLEDFLEAALKDKAAQAKMSKANGRALNRMKLTLRRHNKQYEAKIAARGGRAAVFRRTPRRRPRPRRAGRGGRDDADLPRRRGRRAG